MLKVIKPLNKKTLMMNNNKIHSKKTLNKIVWSTMSMSNANSHLIQNHNNSLKVTKTPLYKSNKSLNVRMKP